MKKQELNIDQIQEKAQKLREELESQINQLSEYINDFELIEATEFYYKSKRGREKYINFKELKFSFKKYFIDTISGSFGRKLLLNKDISTQIKELANNYFKKEDYVLVLCIEDDMGSNILRQLYELLKTQRVGKIIIAGRRDELEEAMVLTAPEELPNGGEKLSVNEVKYDIGIYEGAKLCDQHIILLGEEFGLQNCLTKLIIGSKPKSVLNILISNSGNPFWHDNVD